MRFILTAKRLAILLTLPTQYLKFHDPNMPARARAHPDTSVINCSSITKSCTTHRKITDEGEAPRSDTLHPSIADT